MNDYGQIILALDVASMMGVAEGPVNGIPRLHTVTLARRDDMRVHKIGRAAGWTIERICSGPVPLAVYIEEPVAAGGMRGRTNARTQRLLTSYADTIAGLFAYKGVPVHFVSVGTVRAAILGDGRMRSDLAKNECIRLARAEGLNPQNDNEGDAWAIWRWATSLYSSPRQKALQLV